MKTPLLVACAALLLGSCSKSEGDTPAPDPTLVGGTWAYQSETIRTTPRDGTPPTSSSRLLPVGIVGMRFTEDSHFTSTSASQIVYTGTYTYAGGVLVFTALTPGTATGTLTVIELGAQRLVTTQAAEDAQNRYFYTTVYAR